MLFDLELLATMVRYRKYSGKFPASIAKSIYPPFWPWTTNTVYRMSVKMATVFEWLKRTVGKFQNRETQSRHSGKETFPRVYDSQLEERRVLNAAAVASAIDLVSLHFDAGHAANDGIADKFELTRLDANATNQIAVSINDQRVWQGNAAQLGSIRFDGSSDADQFYIDPTIQVPDGIFVDGTGIATREPSHGTTDIIVFAAASETRFDEVTYQKTDLLTQVRFASAADPLNAANPINTSFPLNGVVQVQNVDSIQDLNLASKRSILVESLGGSYSLQALAEVDRSSASQLVRWTSEQGRIDFAAPSTRLAIDFRGATTGQHSFSIDTTDLSGVEQFDVFGKDTDTVQLKGDLLTGRTMSIQAGAIRVDGTISTASEGDVRLDAGSGVLTINGQIFSQGDDLHRGGNVVLTGDRVLLQERTRVDVSGGRGGGQIRVGGGFQGQDSSVRNSRYTYVSGNATLNADARVSGDGGTIIVWSDDTSIIDGSGNIFAIGGIHSGNGGFVETSGKRYLKIDGAANTFAYQGQVGTWLIDPDDIEIVTVAGVAANTTYILTSTIATALTTGNVSIITNTASAGNGDIRIVAALNLAPTASRTLTLNATRDIVFQSGLIGNSDLNVSLIAGRDVNSTPVTIGQLASLTINAARSVTVGATILSGGAFSATIDSDNNDNNATFHSIGTLSAGSISITGSATNNDDVTLDSSVTATTGSIQFSRIDDLSLLGDVTAATDVSFTNVSGLLSLGSNADITANTGPIDFSTISAGIQLAGSDGSTNVLTANGATGSLTLGSVSATNSNVALTLRSANDISAGAINIQAGTLDAAFNTLNTAGVNSASFNSVTAGRLEISGNSKIDDQVKLNGIATIGSGGVLIDQYNDLEINAALTSTGNITTTGISGSETHLAANVTSNSGNIAMTGGTLFIDGTSNRTISSGGGAVTAGGNITLGNIDGENGAANLTVDSRGASTGGTVSIGTVTAAGSGLNRLNIRTDAATTPGQVTMSGTQLVAKGNTAASLVVDSDGAIIRANGTIDLSSSTTTDGGSIDFGSSKIAPTTASSDLILKTNNTSATGGDGGDITLGGVSNSGANYFDSLSIDTSAANFAKTDGLLNFNGQTNPTLEVDGTSGTGITLVGTILKAFSGVLSFLTNPTGASVDTSSINVTKADFKTTQGLTFDTSGGGSATNAGDVSLGDIGVLQAERPTGITVDTRGATTHGDLILDDGAGSSIELHVDGNLNLANAKIKLTDNALLRTYGTGNMTLGDVATSTAVARNLTLNSETNIAVAAIHLTGGTLNATIDSDNNTVNATFQSTGALAAGTISITGSATNNDDATLGSTATTSTGAVQFFQIDDLTLQGDVTAATNVSFISVSGPLSLGDNVDITSNSGLLDFTTITSGVMLNGANGTTNVITANSTTGSIKLASVSATNTLVSLTLNSATDLDANDINIQSGDLVATYSGQNVVPANVATFQKVTARSMTVSGNSRTDDQTVLADTLTIGAGGVTIDQFSDLKISASITSDADVTSTGIIGSKTHLAANVTSKGGNIAMTGGTLLIDGGAARTIASGGGGVATGGNIVLGNIDGENGAASLTVDSRGTATGGSLTMGAVTDDTSGLNRLNIQSSAPTASGQVTLSSTRLVAKSPATAATLVVSSNGNAIRANGDIDLISNNTIDGGSIDFGSSEITPTTASSTLTVKTSNTSLLGGNGGDIKFGGVSNSGANYFDSVLIDTSATNLVRTSGDLDFNGAASPRIAVDGTTGTGISLIGTILKAFSGVLSFLTNPTGAATSSSSIDVSNADFQSTAGLTFDTSGGGVSTNSGNVVLGDIGVLAANRPDSLLVDTRASATSGDLQLDDGAGTSTEVHVNGDLNLANTEIKLTDNALLKTYGTGNMTLGNVTTSTAVARNLTLNSEANIVVSAINLTGGTLIANIDSDNNNVGSTFQSTGVLTAGTVTIAGSTTINDQVTIGSTLNTTTGSIQFSQIGNLVLNGDVTAQTNVAFANVANELSLGSNVDVTANNGPIDFTVIASGIRLAGSNSSTNILTANGATGSLFLGSVVATNPSVSLTLRSSNNTTLGSVNLQNGALNATIDSDNNNVGSTFVSTGSLIAGTVTISGSTTVNDDVTLGSTVTTTTGAIQVIRFDDLRINGDWTSAGGVTTTGISVSKTHFAANITTNGGNISMADGVLLVNGTNVRQIKSGGAGVNATNGGAVTIGTIDGEVATAELEIDSRGTSTSGGVTLGDVTAAAGNTGVNRLQITTTGPTAGQVALSNIRLIAKSGTAASLRISSNGQAILAEGAIDLSSNVNGQAGGNIDFGTSVVAPKNVSSTLTINTSNTNTTSGPDGSNGGDVLLGGIGVNSAGATYFHSVTLDLSAADILDSAGTLRFSSVANPSIRVDGVTGTGIRILGRVDNAAGGTTSLLTNPAGAIQNSSAIDMSRANFIGSGGLVFDTSGGNRATNSGSISLGDIGITVRPVSLVVDTRGTVSSGHLLLNDGVAGSPTEIRVDGNIDFSNVAVDLLDDVSLESLSDGSSILLGTTNASGGARNLQLSSNSGMTVAGINLLGGAFQANVDANNNEVGATFRSTGTIATGSFAVNGSATNDDLAIIETSLTTTGPASFSNFDQLRIQGTVNAGTTFAATNIAGAVDFRGNSGITANGSIDLQTSVSAVRLSGVAGNTTLIDARGNASVVALAGVTATNPGTRLNVRSDYSADFRNVDLQTGTLDVQIGRSTTLNDSKAQLRQVIAGGLIVAGTSTAKDSVVLDGLLGIGTGGVRIQDVANLDMNFNVQSGGDIVANNVRNRIQVAEAVSIQSDQGIDLQTNVRQIEFVGINGLTNLFLANGDSSSLNLAAIQALQNVVLVISSANNINVASIDAVGSNLSIRVDNNDNSANAQLNAGQIQAKQISILGGADQNDTASFASLVESKSGPLLMSSFGTVNLNGNLLSSGSVEVSSVRGQVNFGAGRLVKASNGDVNLNNGVNEIRFAGGTGTTSSIQAVNGSLFASALTELNTSDLLELRADRDIGLRSSSLNSRLQIIAGDHNSNTGTINSTATLAAGSIALEAATGIGTNIPIATSTNTISATNRLGGVVQIANNKSGSVAFSNLVANQGGNILFTQSGGGGIRFQGVASNPDGTPSANESNIRLSNVGGNLIVDGTGVTAGGLGNVALETQNDGDVQLVAATRASGGTVGIQSARRIIGGGLLQGLAVDLSAQTGIGSAGVVQTQTNRLSVNSQTNSVDVQNTSSTMTTVDHLRSGGSGTVQFRQVGGGDVAFSNVATGVATSSAGSNVNLRNDDGSVLIQGGVVAGGGGSIRFDAQNNLVIGAGAIVQTYGVNATIRGDTGGQFQFAPGATIRAGSSDANTEAVVTKIPPLVSVQPKVNSLGVNVDSLGLASVQLQLGGANPPLVDRNFSVVIDWGDRQIDNFPNGSISPLTINPQISRFDASGVIYEITHQYQGNPNLADPIADIPVRVTVGIDALNRIQFNDSQGAASSLSQVVNERFVVPAAGLFSLRFDLPQAATVQSRIAFNSSVLVQADNGIPPPVSSAEIVVSSGSSAVEKSRSYVLRVITLISEQGEIASSVDIDLTEKDIEELSSGELFLRLGDNRYRIYLIREDGNELLLKDFYLRDHRPFEVEDSATSPNSLPTEERVLDQDTVSIPRQKLGMVSVEDGEFEVSEPEVHERDEFSSKAMGEEKPIANAALAVGTVSQTMRSWRKAARRFRAG